MKNLFFKININKKLSERLKENSGVKLNYLAYLSSRFYEQSWNNNPKKIF
jgi:hypothetical protein